MGHAVGGTCLAYERNSTGRRAVSTTSVVRESPEGLLGQPLETRRGPGRVD
jgi:hypothetical protein